MTFENYKNYGKCAKFEKDGIIAMITVELGPRIIYYGTKDLNFMNEDIERNVAKGGEYFDDTFKQGEKWFLYGGHRVWKSPEDMESYTPDNYDVACEYRAEGGTFTCRIAKRLDYSLEVDMLDGGALSVRNIIRNKGTEKCEIAVWALTVVAKGGKLVVPLNDPVDELNPVQNIVQWPYNDLRDERLSISKTHLVLNQTSKPEALKLGLFSKKNRAYYILGDKMLNFQFVPQAGVYGDFWSNFETYTNAHILEVEGLSPLKTLASGEAAYLEEIWKITDAPRNDNELIKLI